MSRVTVTVIGILVFFSVILAGLLHVYYDDSALALLSALTSHGNYTTETQLGTVRQVNIRYSESALGRDHDFLIYEIIGNNRTLTFESPLSVPIWGSGGRMANTPERAAADLKANVEGWNTYYAACLAGAPDPFGTVSQSVVVQRLDGAESKHLLKWEAKGRIRLNLLVVYASGINRGQVKQERVGFEIPIIPAPSGGTNVFEASIPINAEGLLRHQHIDVNVYRGP